MRNALIKQRVENAKHKQRKPTKKTALNAALAQPTQFAPHTFTTMQNKKQPLQYYIYRERYPGHAAAACTTLIKKSDGSV